MMGSIIEKSTETGIGSKFTHVRIIDMCGNFPAIGVKKMAENVPRNEYAKWNAYIKK